MSGFTYTQAELLYSVDQAATVTSPSTSAVSAIATYPSPYIPGGFFAVSGGTKQSAGHISWTGILTTSSSAPTFTFGIGLSTSDAFSASTVLVVSAAQTMTNSLTSEWFDIEIELALRTQGQAGASTISAHGTGEYFTAATTQAFFSLPAAGSYSPYSSYDTSIQYYVWPYLTLSAATAGNDITTQSLKIWGQN
jgi:hypothetical protein